MKNRAKQCAYSILIITAVSTLSACEGVKSEAKYPSGYDRAITGDSNIYGKSKSIFGEGGIFGTAKRKGNEGDSIGVNSYLWRAALDTVSFMPLTSVDPFGGVILTDWYSPAETPGERMKLNVFIMGRELKSDGIRVRAFRQVEASGVWKDADVSEETTRKLEDAILTRARQMRVAKAGGVE